MSPILRARMDVGVEVVRRDRDSVTRFGGEPPAQSVLEGLAPEGAGTGAGDGDSHAGGSLCDEYTDECEAGGRLRKFHVGGAARHRKLDRGDDLPRVERRLEQALEKPVGGQSSSVG